MNIQATRLESDDEVRQALLKYRPSARSDVSAERPPAPADDGPPLFRPTQRPSTPVLIVCDDGAQEGETIRIRKDSFVIGRTEGDLVIAHDGQISGRHAELRRTLSKDKHRWHLVDLQSTNGTYVRIGHALLDDGQEFVVGRTRLRFQRTDTLPPAAANRPVPQTTQLWQAGPGRSLAPSLVEVTAEGDGPRVLITQKEFWLGKDEKYCQLVLTNDPFASARHARIRQDEQNRWLIENNKSLNGVWLRVERLPLKGTCRFMLGEQQFLVRIGS